MSPIIMSPSWFDIIQGSAMTIKKSTNKLLILSENTAKIIIKKVKLKKYWEKLTGECWIIKWKIKPYKPKKIILKITQWKGLVRMTTVDLNGAFGLSWHLRCSKRFKKYYPDSAHQGKYIRDSAYLNVPNPGKNYNNISILLTLETIEAIKELVQK